MNNANKCPRCKQFILDTYCFTCNEDITKMAEERLFSEENPVADIFKQFFKNNE